MVKTWLNRIKASFRGLTIWLKVGYPFLLLFLVVLSVALVRGSSWLHIWIILILGSILMVAEMLNYAIEKVCDLIDISLNTKIRDIKDICAGAVLVSGIILGIVGLWIIILRFVY